MTEREMGDPLGAFSCPKCGALSIQPRLEWQRLMDGTERILISCDDCGYSERRPTKDALPEDSA